MTERMDDLEMVRLCAVAIGLEVALQLGEWRFPNTQSEDAHYDPLHDDAQAMALVKRFEPDIVYSLDGFVTVSIYGAAALPQGVTGKASDLIRCICECVATIQAEKQAAKAENP